MVYLIGFARSPHHLSNGRACIHIVGFCMEKHSGIFVNYGRGCKRQYAKEGIIRVTDLKPSEASQVIGWMVGWPDREPKMFGRIVGQHGKGGQLMVHFKHGLPGDALGKKIQIIKEKPVPPKRPAVGGERVSSIKDIEGINTHSLSFSAYFSNALFAYLILGEGEAP